VNNIQHSLKEIYKMDFKEGSFRVYSPLELRQLALLKQERIEKYKTLEPCDHLGATPSLRGDGKLQWRHQDAKLDKWAESFDLILTAEIVKVRVAARVLGVIIWHLTLYLQPLCVAEGLLDLCKAVGRRGRDTKWKGNFELSEGDSNFLGRWINEIRLNRWTSTADEEFAHEEPVFGASDASGGFGAKTDGNRWAGIQLFPDGPDEGMARHLDHCRGSFCDDFNLNERAIFYKELFAAVRRFWPCRRSARGSSTS